MAQTSIKLNNGMITIVDPENLEELMEFKWGIIKNGSYIYASRGTRKKSEKYKKILMHRFLMNAKEDELVDHINGNTLDNRKCNLRIANKSTNLRNSKLRSDSNCNYKGVSRRISKCGTVRYNARIQIDSKTRIYLGWFKTEIEAAIVYNNAAIKYFGEFAKLNELY